MGYNGGMGVYTITLSPEEDAALHARAALAGCTAEELLRQAARAPIITPTPDALPPDDALLAEYRDLMCQELRGALTSEGAARLRAVEAELDERDESGPDAHALASRLTQTCDKLDALLQALRDLAAVRPPVLGEFAPQPSILGE